MDQNYLFSSTEKSIFTRFFTFLFFVISDNLLRSSEIEFSYEDNENYINFSNFGNIFTFFSYCFVLSDSTTEFRTLSVYYKKFSFYEFKFGKVFSFSFLGGVLSA